MGDARAFRFRATSRGFGRNFSISAKTEAHAAEQALLWARAEFGDDVSVRFREG